MSLAALIVQPTAVHLITDAAIIGPDGELLAIESKVSTFPEIGLAVSFTGCCHAARIEEAIGSLCAKDPATALRGLAGVAEALSQTNREHGEREWGIRLVAALWDRERQIGTGWLYDNIPASPTNTAGRLRNTQGYIDFAAPADIFGRDIDVRDPTSFDVERDAVTLIEAARRAPWADDTGAPPIYAVGGFGEVTTCDANGIRRRTVIEWPNDRVGGAIGSSSPPR